MRIPFLQAALGAGLAFGLVACGGGSNQANMQNSNATKPAAQPAAPAAAAEGSSSMSRQMRLLPLNNSNVNGSATLTPKGDSLTVAVDVNGLPGGAGAYPSHIQAGTCANPGAVLQPLSDVQADSTGEGHATTTVAMSVIKQGQQHLVMVNAKDGSTASCGDIPGDLTSSGM